MPLVSHLYNCRVPTGVLAKNPVYLLLTEDVRLYLAMKTADFNNKLEKIFYKLFIEKNSWQYLTIIFNDFF